MRGVRAAALLMMMGVAAARLCGAEQDFGRKVDGGRVRTLAPAGTRAVVLFFVGTECPVSNRTFPEMRRVRTEFEGRGVRFLFVYADADEKAAGVKAHQREYDAGGQAVLDDGGTLTRLAGVIVTPEVAVLVPAGSGWRPVFAGRIDNRYVRLGLERPQATEHYAERVIGEVLEGRPVEKPAGTPVGCGILTATGAR